LAVHPTVLQTYNRYILQNGCIDGRYEVNRRCAPRRRDRTAELKHAHISKLSYHQHRHCHLQVLQQRQQDHRRQEAQLLLGRADRKQAGKPVTVLAALCHLHNVPSTIAARSLWMQAKTFR